MCNDAYALLDYSENPFGHRHWTRIEEDSAQNFEDVWSILTCWASQGFQEWALDCGWAFFKCEASYADCIGMWSASQASSFASKCFNVENVIFHLDPAWLNYSERLFLLDHLSLEEFRHFPFNMTWNGWFILYTKSPTTWYNDNYLTL